MGRAMGLGRLSGVPLAMSWVVPPVALLYAWVLADRILPVRVPYQSQSSYWLAATAGATLFFLSLLAHELAHAAVGRREGVGVRRVTLTLLGGYTRFDTEPDTPGAEFRVSVVGPLANLVLALAFWLMASGLRESGGRSFELWAETLAGLALVNLLLAVANLAPVSPLDGGAALGALVWMVTGDRNRADQVSGTLGVALGVGLTLTGAWLWRSGHPVAPWAIACGAALAFSAGHRLRAAPTLGRLRGTTIGSVMAVDPPVIDEATVLIDVVTQADAWQPHTAFPVRGVDGTITGLLTAELVMAVDPMSWPKVTSGEVALPVSRLATARPDEAVLTALQRADATGLDRLLVVGPDGEIAGVAGRDALGAALRR